MQVSSQLMTKHIQQDLKKRDRAKRTKIKDSELEIAHKAKLLESKFKNAEHAYKTRTGMVRD